MTYTIITGASKGIGKAIAYELAAQGRNLILVARSGDLLGPLAKELSGKSVDVRYLPIDLLGTNAVEQVFDWIDQQKLEVDTLINNAGAGYWGKFADKDIAGHLRIMHLNMDTMLAMAHMFLTHTPATRRRYILNTVSTAAFQPVPYMAVYCASKAFMLSWSRALRYEVRPLDVYVTALCPGPTDSEFSNAAGMASLTAKYSKFHMTAEAVAKAGIKGLWRNKSVVIPGFINQISAIASRFSPQDMVTAMSAQFFKNN